MMQSNFENKYRNWLENQEPSFENELWDAIEDELDFNDTWVNIENKLEYKLTKKNSIFSLNVAFIPQVLLFCLVFIPKILDENFVFWNNSYDYNFKLIDKSKNISETVKKNNEAKYFSNQNLNGLNKRVFNNDFKSLPDIEKLDSVLNSYNNYSMLNIENLDSITIKSDSLTTQHLKPNSDINFVTELTDSNLSKSDSSIKNPNFKIIDAGIMYSLKNTWLLNNETKSGFNSNKLNNTLFTLNRSWGLISTFQLYNKHLISAEFFWKSLTGQNYQEYINASFANTSIRLQYISFQTIYILNTKLLRGNILLGAYFSNLQNAQKQINNFSTNIKNNYLSYDYGTLIGYQLNFKIFNKMELKVSYRFNYSLNNIYNSNNIYIRGLNKTTNVSNSINLSLNYIFN